MIRSKRQGCRCKLCQECCKREPGWFLPGEIAVAAKFVQLTEAEFVKSYCVEHMVGEIRALSPAQKNNTTECIFLSGNGRCDIHPVKPHECRKVFGCEKVSRHRRIREIILRTWR